MTVELYESTHAVVGEAAVRRALPRRAHRTVGAWCFLDHFGPAGSSAPLTIGPHPHIGLQTVTWLLEGELVHSDSLGSEQPIRPGQLNLMSAGHGVVHAEDGRSAAGAGHGVQLWIAQPEATRHGPAAFEHHAHLPAMSMGAGHATVLTGSFGGTVSKARTDTPLVGVDLVLDGRADLPLEPSYEYAVVVLSGSLVVDATTVPADTLAYVGAGRDEVRVAAERTRALLLGGVPFGEEITMWWNFVARSRDEMDEARAAWEQASDRFGTVRTDLARVPAPALTR